MDNRLDKFAFVGRESVQARQMMCQNLAWDIERPNLLPESFVSTENHIFSIYFFKKEL